MRPAPPPPPPLSRRDFLRLAGLGLLSLALPGFDLLAPGDPVFNELAPDQQGRVADPTISIYDRPSFDGNRVKLYWRDLVLPINGIAVSDDEQAYNRIWYLIGDEGYAYSGAIQPVRTQVNQPVAELPPGGALAEVTVPFTDARRQPAETSEFVYRLYYDTTHWVEAAETNPDDGSIWYRLYDDKYKQIYYVPARHLRLFTPEDLAPISPHVPDYYKRIEVRLGQQLLIAYEDGRPVFASRVATGGRFSSGNYTTPVGLFITYHKRPSRHMAAGDLASNGYDLPGVPWVQYILENGISLHGTYWHNDFGRPRSHGCINMPPAAARWLFRWTSPHVPFENQFVSKSYGTYVEIIP